MAAITTIFFDVGGVLLSNGWDTSSRQNCIESFGLDYEEFSDRHEFVSEAFETGRLSLEQYLNRTVFYRERDFSQSQFWEAMVGESQPNDEALAIADKLAEENDLLLATLNNESAELNRERIRRFNLDRYFTSFFSSGFLGVKKPDEAIYRIALEVTQRKPHECLFIDDRDINLEGARAEGMETVLFEDAAGLRSALSTFGIDVESRESV